MSLNRTLGIALVAQVALFVGVSFAKEEPKMAAAAKVFPELVADKITEIEISGDAATGAAGGTPVFKSVKLVKSGTAWGVASADNYPVDNAKITTLLETLGKLKSSGEVVSKESYYKKLEVADDDYQRKVTVTYDGKPLAFLLGSSPGFKRVHLRKVGEKDVRLVEGVSVWDVGFKAADWVERAYVKVPDADVWAVTVQNAKGTFQLEKSLAGEWALLGAKEPVKKQAVEDLVRKISTVNLEEPVGKSEKPEYGLGQPQATITLVVGTSTIPGTPPKSTTTQTLKVGVKTAEGNSYYVRSSKSDYVVTSAAWAIDPLATKAAADLYDTPGAAPAPAAPHALPPGAPRAPGSPHAPGLPPHHP